MKRGHWLISSMMVMGWTLLMTQGCSLKSVQSDGNVTAGAGSGSTTGSSGRSDGQAWNGQGVNPNAPGFGQSGAGNELNGFSQNPSDERLSSGGYRAVSLSPAELAAKRRAELLREEQAAREAGLQDVFFGYDQWMVSHTGMASLERDARWLKDHPGALLKIEGHCDERGTMEYNMVLGDKRAKAAQAYLIENGVNPAQVAIVSYGKERPFCADHAEACYQENRRGHMLLSTRE